jgi:hypothetical protein
MFSSFCRAWVEIGNIGTFSRIKVFTFLEPIACLASTTTKNFRLFYSRDIDKVF